MLAELRTARVEGNADRFRRAAHSLKSSSATLGAARLSECCRRIEEATRTGRADGVAKDIAAAEDAFEQAARLLRREIDASDLAEV